LNPQVLFTAPGRIVEDAAAVLERTISYLEKTRDEIAALAGRGLPAGQIVLEIFGRESSLKEMTQGQFSTENFVRSLIPSAFTEAAHPFGKRD
ncbi:MAG: hypothetical protein ACPLRH_08810, partial [Desulfotomaculales bacterium]